MINVKNVFWKQGNILILLVIMNANRGELFPLVLVLGLCSVLFLVQVQANGCNPYPCSVHSTSCTPGLGNSYTCNCVSPFIGQNCTTTPCSPNPCSNNGTCHVVPPNSYNCSCLFGFKGTNCTTVTDFCNPDPCRNGGICTSIPGHGWTCTGCNTGYGGRNCTTCQQYYRCVNNQSQTVDSNTNCGHICAYNTCLQPENLWPCDSGDCIADKIIPESSPATFNYTCDCDHGYVNANCSACAVGFNFSSDGCDCIKPSPPSPFIIVNPTNPMQAWIIVFGVGGGAIGLIVLLFIASWIWNTLNLRLGHRRGSQSEITLTSLRGGAYNPVSTIEPE